MTIVEKIFLNKPVKNLQKKDEFVWLHVPNIEDLHAGMKEREMLHTTSSLDTLANVQSALYFPIFAVSNGMFHIKK